MKPSSNIIPMPTRPTSPHRANAREMIEQYYAKKKREQEREKGTITQQDIDGRPKGWERESDTTNARLARILGDEN